MQEEFRVINDFENYVISNFGNIRNIKTGRNLKLGMDSNGYHRVCFNKKCYRIHRFVALMFIPNPENKDFVDHLDRDRTNNHVSNLRWATRRENNINTKVRINNNSTITGVQFYKPLNKWLVAINIDGIRKHIGYYKDFDEAVRVRKEQEDIHYKEFKAIQN